MPPRSRLTDFLTQLPGQHVAALRWFEDHAGQEVPWPQPLDDGTLLATKAKGIYKPAWSNYALSVRQSLGGQYPDREIEEHPDGSWRYLYFQENLDPSDRDGAYTNHGLMACYRDGIPVGVLRQTHGKPQVRYLVLGLALVDGWEEGYFVLDGVGLVAGFGVRDSASRDQASMSFLEAVAAPFELASLRDERQRTIREIRVRQGQTGFRRQLLDAYEGRCAVTHYDASEALEAAHIVPYRGPVTNHAQNGILLRSDLHSLFDLGLVAIREDTLRVVVSPDLRSTKYAAYEGVALVVPESPLLQPSRIALARHRGAAGL